MITRLRRLCLPLAVVSLTFMFYGNASAQDSCVVKGNTLSEARDLFASQCSVQRVDCDPFGGEWFCASFNMQSSQPPALTSVSNSGPADPVAPTPVNTPQATTAEVITAPAPVAEAITPPAPVAEVITPPAPVAEVITPPAPVAEVITPPVPVAEVIIPPAPAAEVVAPPAPVAEVIAPSISAAAAPQELPTAEIQSQPRPQCSTASSDSDGDGFGWENNRTCLVAETAVAEPDPPVGVSVTTSSSSNSRPVCTSATSDSDGDGFGWENNATCLAAVSTEQPQRVNSQQPATVSARTAADITDLILVTGQSNALGAETAFNAQLDAVNSSVFAFTNEGWQVADLNQVWDLNWHPRNHPETDPSNNFAFHFGKNVAQRRGDRVIGFILATAPGAAISHWENNGQFYGRMQAKVLDAINQLPHKSALDGILWHQGESDGRDEQYYTDALYTLISNLRSEPWVVTDAPFICGETKIASINRRLNGLNRDTDPNTACVAGEDLSTRADMLHLDAPALRTLGARYATAYLNIRP